MKHNITRQQVNRRINVYLSLDINDKIEEKQRIKRLFFPYTFAEIMLFGRVRGFYTL